MQGRMCDGGRLAWGWRWPVSSRADLTQALAEPNLEKRSQVALNNAAAAYKAARAAYEKGESDAGGALASREIQESVELAYTSLTQTGKDPRRSPKWFKKAEMNAGSVEAAGRVRARDGLQRPAHAGEGQGKVQQVHDELLVG